ncbi:MAG: protein kinase [bacterium]|nr:MAG: protein kinase [bacterium]
MDLKPGQKIFHYQLLEQLGSGGMAVVYKALDEKLDRPVALKFLPLQAGIQEREKQRFILEAKTASALDHPNICTIYEINETERGQVFISMAFYEGETLKDKIERGPLSVKETLHIIRQVCLGLQKAHDKGIVHRDIKPANIMVTTDGVVKILDFGVAKFQHKIHVTQPGTVIGTPGYMAPEQAAGKEVDHRVDLWAAGILLFEMLTAHLPFEGDNDLAVMYAIVNENPLSLNSFRAQDSSALQQILNHALEKEPDRRYQNMQDLMNDLESLEQKPSVAPETRQTVISVPSTPSIAVLPLIDLSPDRDQEYFCDGLAEEIINALTRIKDLKVISRNSAFQFKGENLDISQIGRRLGVQKVLEGSLRKGGDRIRVTVRLINVSDGFLIWADDYERELEDIFAIQDDIARSIVNNLKIKLIDISETQLLKKYTDNVEAFSAYLQGRFFWNKRTADSLEKSIEYFNQAIQLDSQYALAYAGLADAYIVLGLYGKYALPDVMPQALKAVRQAEAIDDSLAEAHISEGCIQAIYQWNWESSENQFRKGIELKPEYALGHHWYAINFLTPRGRFEEAQKSINQALESEPLSLVIHSTIGLIHYFNRRYEQAIRHLEKTLLLDPNYPVTHFFLGRALVQAAKFPEAMDHLQQALKFFGDSTNMLATFAHAAALAGKEAITHKILTQLQEISQRMYVSSYDIASIYVGLGQTGEALTWLEKALQERAYLLIYLEVDPIMDPLRKEKRFQELVEQIFSKDS